MIPANITLIVKAPNQQIDDQNVECQSSWTVKQLKGHLSEVYPSKPTTDEQKIIYSGQLLEDNVVLKDVLRTYESQVNTHTMHLVCTRKMTEAIQPAKTDGLRQRNVSPTEVQHPETRQNDQNHTVEMQNHFSSIVNNYGRVPYTPNYNLSDGYLPVPNDPAMLANHMIMMQQAYFQYMQQYANMWQAGALPTVQAPTEAEATPQPAPAAPAPPAEEGEDMARDWLDYLYGASRIAILLSLVYLYGSPARLLLVLFLTAVGYLHQIGFFRDLRIAGDRVNAPAENQIRPNDDNAPRPADTDRPVDNADDNTERLTDDSTRSDDSSTATETVENQQSLLAVTWMIFTSFFASLIPDSN